MNVLNFLPLLAWMLFMPLTVVVGYRIEGKEMTESGAKGAAFLWIGGTVFWLFIAVALSA